MVNTPHTCQGFPVVIFFKRMGINDYESILYRYVGKKKIMSKVRHVCKIGGQLCTLSLDFIEL